MQNKLHYFLLYFFIIITLCLGVFFVAHAQTSPDAIAVRVIPNPNHYSALNWYNRQGFRGAPQSLVVDEYEAVRDGRTVYVNAANINNGNLYTNIYLISFNQSAEQHTSDIFGRMLERWKFNANFLNDTDFCSESTARQCLYSKECPIGEYCNSEKAQVTRDTRRLSDLTDMRENINEYYYDNGYYPRLSSGTYLPHKTISVWPSWQDNFSKDLNSPLPVDPINKLGACAPNFNQITGWDERTKTFADPTPADATFDLPAGSRVYAYTSVVDGKSYNLCAYMESVYVNDINNCHDNLLNNHAPVIDCGNLSALPNRRFSKFITAYDPDGDRLVNWNFNFSGTNWDSWTAAPDDRNSARENVKEVFGQTAASTAGSFDFTVSVSDNKNLPNSSTSTTCTINICAPNCDGRECGSDGCGGVCQPGCSPGVNCVNGRCDSRCLFDFIFNCYLF
jgi:hypothetical protein